MATSSRPDPTGAAAVVATATADVEQIRRDAKLAAEQAHAALDTERCRVETQLDQRLAALRAVLTDASPVEAGAAAGSARRRTASSDSHNQ
jgi:hypothetical protein